ncbi:hypothetical protein SLEP1_g58533 [Rubroshorea leprosula]|uniref:Uncharacterized protein n=1 Tax=Rubroshorea leprosula TaxID=152421 RepID=A0AAV5MSV8_9ROSI|nr:hypothetical protein SLEP1_g58533 [Rubroshorea leprosula]
MDHPNQGGDKDEQFPGKAISLTYPFFFSYSIPSQLLVDDIPDSFWNEAGHGAPTPQLDQEEENFLEGLESLFGVDDHDVPDSSWDVTGSLDEWNSLNLHNPQTWNFGNRSVSGTEQPGTQKIG